MKQGRTISVCSLRLSETTQQQLESLGGNGERLQTAMAKRALSANVDQPCSFDNPDTHLRAGFADDLRESGVRKERIMGHRVFFVGSHTDCNFTVFFIKLNKKGDDERQNDNNAQFHEKLRQALTGQIVKTIPDPNIKTEIEKPAWQNAEWYKKYGKLDSSE